MARGRVHHIGNFGRNAEVSRADFHSPVLQFLGYRPAEGSAGISFWRDSEGGLTLHLVQTEGGVRPNGQRPSGIRG